MDKEFFQGQNFWGQLAPLSRPSHGATGHVE